MLLKDITTKTYQEDLFWEDSFDEYLDRVIENPKITRSAFQRLYDMIVSHGTEEYYSERKNSPLQLF